MLNKNRNIKKSDALFDKNKDTAKEARIFQIKHLIPLKLQETGKVGSE